MRIKSKEIPREFSPAPNITLRDCGNILLEENEQITFTDENGLNSDFTRKEWGYYLANALNHRISFQGYKTALFASQLHSPPSLYVCLVQEEKKDLFFSYLESVEARLLMWLDEIDAESLFQD